MTICIAAPSFNQASETFIRDHVRSIAPHATVLASLDSADARQFGCPMLSGLDHWEKPITTSQRLVNMVRFRWRRYVAPGLSTKDRIRLIAFLRSHQTKGVLAEYGPTGCLLAPACRAAGVPLYVHFHGYDASRLLHEVHQARHYRRLFRMVAGIIAPSRFLARKLSEAGCPRSKLHVSACGVDLDRFCPSYRCPQQIVSVGRLVEKKAPHLTILAFNEFATRYPQARLDIIGGGPLWQRCCELINDLHLGNQISMHGVQGPERVAELMQRASLYVQHSVTAADGDTEGLPVAILEAMASALPVVSTRHSGIPEVVQEGISGLLVEESDIAGMASAMCRLLDNPMQAAAMGVRGRERIIESFTLEHSRDRLRTVMGLSPIVVSKCIAPSHGEASPASS